MSTVYRLLDLHYNVFIISDNLFEIPVDATGEGETIKKALLQRDRTQNAASSHQSHLGYRGVEPISVLYIRCYQRMWTSPTKSNQLPCVIAVIA